ncbi:thioredoxin [Pseudodesulfovibrio sp. JC047]|uniref:thioredoxin family protein n=1 Tax=Pseudodesulfovibrio sp. JC047 TaxID=2683199 RepID=UPI0013D4C762|nr:thioredoxin family protein [Pseudodesulfovibrio sp. JC047]NDV19584.1 thioredoxin [Pseudodesulfovibrio sp. JC047]
MEPQTVDRTLSQSKKPVFVAFLKRNERFAKQIGIVSEMAMIHRNRVQCFLYDSDYLDTAQDQFSVKGTPTFVLFDKGREVDRLIGESDGETLDDFIMAVASNA